MESAYGIGIKNRYELFYDDEEDPLDIIKQQEEEKKKKKETKQQQEKENKVKGPGPAPSKAKNIISVKKGPKESLPVKAQEPSVPRKDDNNRARSQKPQTDRVVKFSSNIREENKDLEERKNRRNREDPRPERSGPPEFRERGGGFDRNAQWDGGERNSGGGNTDRDRNDLKENRSNDGENRRGRGGFGGRGGFRGRGRGRGGPGGPGYDNRGKREFERQSGSDKRYNGVKAVDKREGGGSHNWGTIRDDMETLNNTAALSSDEAPEWAEKTEETTEVQSEKEGEQTSAVATEGGESDKPPTEEGPKIMTLDEYKKEQEKKRAVPQFNIRKAGEGEDSTQWKKTYVLKKKDEEEDTEEMEEITDDEEDIRRGRAKHVVDIEINYSDSRRGRGRGRGGRGGPGPRGGTGSAGLGREGGGGGGGGGGGRGSFNRGSDGAGGTSPGSSDNGVGALGGEGRGRGGSGGISREGAGPRGGRGGRGGKNQSAPKVDDENDFPSLVAA